MKIIFLRSNPVDPDTRVEKEVNSLVKAGYDVEIVAWDRGSRYKIQESYLNLEVGKVKISRFGIPATYGGGIKKNMGPLILFQLKLYYWLSKNKNNYDIIHACDFDTAYTAFKVAKRFNKKFVYDIYDYYVDAFGIPNNLKNYIENKDHKIIDSSDGVIICSEKRLEQIKGTNPKRLAVVHNTPKDTKNYEKLGLDKTKLKIVYVGVLDRGRFIKEIAEIVKDNHNYELHIGGFGVYEQYLKEMSNSHSNIKFYGKLPYEKTLELENNCDIITAIYDPKVANHKYAAPNKFYEALMLGKPLIMVRNTGMDEIVSKYGIGEIIEYSSKSLERALENLQERQKELSDIEGKMKNLYKKFYSWSIMEQKLLDLYKEI